MRPEISIVIPVMNEAENVEELYRELAGSLDPMQRPYEIVFVDDGSSDGTADRILAIESRDARVSISRIVFSISLSRTAGPGRSVRGSAGLVSAVAGTSGGCSAGFCGGSVRPLSRGAGRGFERGGAGALRRPRHAHCGLGALVPADAP